MPISMAPFADSFACRCPRLEPGCVLSAISPLELEAGFAASPEAAGLREGVSLPTGGRAAAPLSRNAGAAWAFGGGIEVAAGREVGG